MVALVATWAADSGWGLLLASTGGASSCGQGMREPWCKEHEELVGDSPTKQGRC